jgi:hypothetical protein
MLKKILILLCLGAFIATAAVGCKKKPKEEPKTPAPAGETGNP